MNRERLEHPQVRRPVTQEEASEIIELWTRLAEPASGAALDLGDVREALHISDAEAERLLAQVREGQAAARPRLDARAVNLYLLLGLSVAWSAAFFVSSATDMRGMDAFQQLGMLLALAWTIGWLWWCRKPLGRALGAAGGWLSRAKP